MGFHKLFSAKYCLTCPFQLAKDLNNSKDQASPQSSFISMSALTLTRVEMEEFRFHKWDSPQLQSRERAGPQGAPGQPPWILAIWNKDQIRPAVKLIWWCMNRPLTRLESNLAVLMAWIWIWDNLEGSPLQYNKTGGETCRIQEELTIGHDSGRIRTFVKLSRLTYKRRGALNLEESDPVLTQLSDSTQLIIRMLLFSILKQ